MRFFLPQNTIPMKDELFTNFNSKKRVVVLFARGKVST